MTIDEADIIGIREILQERNILLSHAITFIEKLAMSGNEPSNEFLQQHIVLLEKFEKEYSGKEEDGPC